MMPSSGIEIEPGTHWCANPVSGESALARVYPQVGLSHGTLVKEDAFDAVTRQGMVQFD